MSPKGPPLAESAVAQFEGTSTPDAVKVCSCKPRRQHVWQGPAPGFADVQRQCERGGCIAAQRRDRRLRLPLAAPGGLVVDVQIHRIVLRRVLLIAAMPRVFACEGGGRASRLGRSPGPIKRGQAQRYNAMRDKGKHRGAYLCSTGGVCRQPTCTATVAASQLVWKQR